MPANILMLKWLILDRKVKIELRSGAFCFSYIVRVSPLYSDKRSGGAKQVKNKKSTILFKNQIQPQTKPSAKLSSTSFSSAFSRSVPLQSKQTGRLTIGLISEVIESTVFLHTKQVVLIELIYFELFGKSNYFNLLEPICKYWQRNDNKSVILSPKINAFRLARLL